MKKIINKIKNTIKDTKFENKCFIAGGYVRDLIMNKPSKDIDITVNIENGGIELANLLYKRGISNKPVIFQRFGTAQIIINYEQIELVETRKESYAKDSRKPDVVFGSIEDDVRRRDFTINSILYNISTGEILDILDGKKDIENKIIRTTSEPDLIFEEDPLRILRAIRFSCQLDFDIEEKTLQSAINMKHRLSIISKERIRDEFSKMMISNNVKKALDLLIETGIIEYIVPELKEVLNMEQPKQYHTKDVYGHTLEVIDRINNTLEHRLAALFHDIGKGRTFSVNEKGEIHFYGHQEVSMKIAKKVLIELKYSSEVIEYVTTAVKYHMAWEDNNLNKKTIRKHILKLGRSLFNFCLDLARADINSHKGRERISLIEEIALFALNDDVCKEELKLPINGDDVMKELNIKPGKIVGEILTVCKDRFLEDPSITREDLISLVKELYNSKITIEYYNRNSEKYYEETINRDLSELYNFFLDNINGDKILDLGCGVGRDSIFFTKNNFNVVSIDYSELMYKMSSKVLPNVIHMNMLEISYENLFDGVWCCNSLLHLNDNQLETMISKIYNSLKQEGILFMSFKYGDFLGIRNERYFNDKIYLLIKKLVDKKFYISNVYAKYIKSPINGNTLSILNVFCIKA